MKRSAGFASVYLRIAERLYDHWLIKFGGLQAHLKYETNKKHLVIERLPMWAWNV